VKFLTVKQAAEALGVSQAIVYALCAARRIRHQRIGLGRGTIRIPEDAIAEYRESVTVEPVAVAAGPRQRRPFRHLR
jgi:excisionase family DNA binding protein